MTLQYTLLKLLNLHMNSEFPFIFYYLGLFISTVYLSRFILKKYIHFAKNYNLTDSSNSRTARKGNILTGAGVVFASVVVVAALVLENLDFVKFSNFSPVIATSILISILGFYNDLVDISSFNVLIILLFLILMLLYSNSTLPVIQNLNGFLGLNSLGFIPGLLFTAFIYLFIMNAINFIVGIDEYLVIFSIFFFISLLYIFDINQFYTLNSVSVIIIGCSTLFLFKNFSTTSFFSLVNKTNDTLPL